MNALKLIPRLVVFEDGDASRVGTKHKVVDVGTRKAKLRDFEWEADCVRTNQHPPPLWHKEAELRQHASTSNLTHWPSPWTLATS